jgi:hypothetical protein
MRIVSWPRTADSNARVAISRHPEPRVEEGYVLPSDDFPVSQAMGGYLPVTCLAMLIEMSDSRQLANGALSRSFAKQTDQWLQER